MAPLLAMALLQRQIAKLASRLLYSWSLLRNNNTAINLEMFTLSYGSSSGATPSVFSLDLVFFHFIWCSSVFMAV